MKAVSHILVLPDGNSIVAIADENEELSVTYANVMKQLYHNEVPSFVYLMSTGTHTKVGKSNNPHKRLKELQTGNPLPIKLIGIIECVTQTDTFRLEKSIHGRLADRSAVGEWFVMTDIEVEKLWLELQPTEPVISMPSA